MGVVAARSRRKYGCGCTLLKILEITTEGRAYEYIQYRTTGGEGSTTSSFRQTFPKINVAGIAKHVSFTCANIEHCK